MISKKFTIPVLLLSLLIAASCTPSSPPATVPAATETSTIEPGDTPLPAITPTFTLNQTQANCTDSASFVDDVTVPDGTKFDAGVSFLKTWRIRNTGTCTWNENYGMVFVEGTQMTSPAVLPLAATAPGETLDVSVNLVAPSEDGVYTGFYELQNPAGELILIDETRFIWVKISVGTGVAQGATPVAGTGTGTSGTCTYTENSVLLNEMFALINSARVVNGLPELTLNAKLSAAAMRHSIDMACSSRLSHTGSDGSYITDRIAAQGYTYSYWNEAIYAQPPEYGGNAQAAVDWWLNDPPHRVILLAPDATEIGVGYAYVAGSALGGYFTIDVAAP